MFYSIKTLDGYNFRLEAGEDYCIDLVNGDNADIGWANESEVLAWVAENIENIGVFMRATQADVMGN
jgi:hypothetical protein